MSKVLCASQNSTAPVAWLMVVAVKIVLLDPPRVCPRCCCHNEFYLRLHQALRDGRDCYRFIFLSDPQVSYPIGAQYLSNSPSTLAQFGAPAGTNRKLLNSVAAEGLAEAAACPCP